MTTPQSTGLRLKCKMWHLRGPCTISIRLNLWSKWLSKGQPGWSLPWSASRSNKGLTSWTWMRKWKWFRNPQVPCSTRSEILSRQPTDWVDSNRRLLQKDSRRPLGFFLPETQPLWVLRPLPLRKLGLKLDKIGSKTVTYSTQCSATWQATEPN